MRLFPQILSTSVLTLSLVTGLACAVGAQTATEANIDRNATFRITWSAPPVDYDPPLAKNQFPSMAYSMPIYDTLVRINAKSEIIPSIATSWNFSDDKKMLTLQLRSGMKFTDGSEVNADAVVKSLNRAKNDPASLLASTLSNFESFEAKGPSTVVIRLKAADTNALYTLTTSTGMIVSAKALDDKVNLSTTPVGSGPYKLVSSGPQGATYDRNDDYYDKTQNQYAKLVITPIGDIPARLSAVQTGQADVGLFQGEQIVFTRSQAMVKSGKFKVQSAPTSNSMPLILNTKIKPFDNPKVRMALNLAIDREAINQGIMNGECNPASQPLPAGVVGHDESLQALKPDIAKAKQLLQESGVGPFSFEALTAINEPYTTMAVAIKDQLQQIGVTMNILPTQGSTLRPTFRAGNHAAMVFPISVTAADPSVVLDAIYMGPDNPGGVGTQFAAAIADAKTKAMGSPEREAAYKGISKMAYDEPQHVFVCWSPGMLVYRNGIVGADKAAYLSAVAIPEVRSFGVLKTGN